MKCSITDAKNNLESVIEDLSKVLYGGKDGKPWHEGAPKQHKLNKQAPNKWDGATKQLLAFHVQHADGLIEKGKENIHNLKLITEGFDKDEKEGAPKFQRFAALAEATAATNICLLYTSPSPRDRTRSRMPSSA